MTTETTQDYREFVLRRLHSLTGVLPLGGFVFFHWFMNSYSRQGPDAFNQVVAFLRSMPYLHFLEWGLLFAPFLFHIFLGIWIIFTAKSNLGRQQHARNFMYVLQRVTAIIIMVFIFYHVATTTFSAGKVFAQYGENNFYDYMQDKFANPVVYWWYIVAVACVSFHLANGICTFCMTWGLTVGRQAQRMMAVAMTGAGIAVFAIGVGAINGFLLHPKATEPAPIEILVEPGVPAENE